MSCLVVQRGEGEAVAQTSVGAAWNGLRQRVSPLISESGGRP
jgi:hypothetical protein